MILIKGIMERIILLNKNSIAIHKYFMLGGVVEYEKRFYFS